MTLTWPAGFVTDSPGPSRIGAPHGSVSRFPLIDPPGIGNGKRAVFARTTRIDCWMVPVCQNVANLGLLPVVIDAFSTGAK